MNKNSKIYVAGHRGLVGSSIIQHLKQEGYSKIICRTREELDLTRQASVEAFFEKEKPEFVFLAAAKVGGILANSHFPADFIYQNILIEANVINAAHVHGVKKLMFLGTSCIYPKESPQPMKEEYLLSGHLEPSNQAYAVAKIAGIEMCQSYAQQYGDKFISVMPPNIYGPRDTFDLQTSHVIPASIRKFHEAKKDSSAEVIAWGSGTARREFLYVDDLAEACLFLMQTYDNPSIINIGAGTDVTIHELMTIIQRTVGYQGALRWDTSKPEGSAQKLLDTSRIYELGWKPKTSLEEGIKLTYLWYTNNLVD